MSAQIAALPAIAVDDAPKATNSRCYFSKAFDLFYVLQGHLHRFYVSHRGAYSVEQVQAFDTYQHQTPLWRVVCVCVALPLGPLSAAIALDCVPLQDPRLGWKANYGMYIRNTLMCLITGTGVCIQTKQLMPTLSMSNTKIFLVAAVSSIFANAFLLLLAVVWAFPVPFGYAIAPVPWAVVLALLFVLAVGRKQLKDQPSLIGELQRQCVIIQVQVTLCIVYPVFNAVYLRLNPHEQTVFIFMLPMIKFVMQNIIAWSTSHLVEFMPGVTLFSVEVFNALYLAKCMQSANSKVTYLVIMAVDLLKMVLNFYTLQVKATRITQMMQRSQLPSNSLLYTMIAFCQQPEVLSSRGSKIQLRSTLRHLRLSESSVNVLKQLTQAQLKDFMTVDNQAKESTPKKSVRQSKMISITKVVPVKTNLAIEPDAVPAGFKSSIQPAQPVAVNALTPEEKREFVHDSLKILFHCEYHLLVEYIEFMIPSLYSVYMVVLFHLPTVEYYPETKNMTQHQLKSLITNITSYAALEFLSFLGMHFAIKRKFGFSPAYLVAFVLENRFIELQARLGVLFAYILGFTLEHFGTDLTLQFAWMTSK